MASVHIAPFELPRSDLNGRMKLARTITLGDLHCFGVAHINGVRVCERDSQKDVLNH